MKHSKYKYTYYQNTHTLQNPHVHTHTLQNKIKQPKYKKQCSSKGEKGISNSVSVWNSRDWDSF